MVKPGSRRGVWTTKPTMANADSTPSVLEKLQRAGTDVEIWWDSSPLDFASWRQRLCQDAPDPATRRRWQGQLDRFLSLDDPLRSLVRGATTNPSLIARSVLQVPHPWSELLRGHLASARGWDGDAEAAFRVLYEEAVRRAAAAMIPMWELTHGRYGWVCGQVDPRHAFDAARMLDQGLRLARLSPNLMVKVPGTLQGFEVVRQLVARGISVNGTLNYTVAQFLACARAVEQGLDQARRHRVDLTRWRAVSTYMIGRLGSDGDLGEEASSRCMDLSHTDLRWGEVAVLKRIHQLAVVERSPVKVLVSSLSIDNRDRGATTLSMHLEQTAGGRFVYTCKPRFVADLMRRGASCGTSIRRPSTARCRSRCCGDSADCRAFNQAIEPDGLRPEQFGSYGAFVATFAELSRNTRRLVDFAAQQVESARNNGWLTPAATGLVEANR